MLDAQNYILNNIDIRDGHWFFRRKPNNAGYVNVTWEGKKVGSHVLAYRAWKGDIPPKFHVDHRCEFTACCNPDCLEAVPQYLNSKLVYRRRFGQMSRRDLRISRLLHNIVGTGGWPV